MEWTILAVVVVFVVLMILSIKLSHGVFKIVSFIFSTLTVLGLILGIVLVFDAFTFQEKSAEEPMVFVLMDNESLVTGVILHPKAEEPVVMLPLDEQNMIANEQEEELLGKYYKIWFLNKELLDEIEKGEFDLGQGMTQKSEVDDMLFGDGLQQMQASIDETKSLIFAGVIVKETMSNPVFMFKQYKKGNIRIVKESLMFTALKLLPLKPMEKFMLNNMEEIRKSSAGES